MRNMRMSMSAVLVTVLAAAVAAQAPATQQVRFQEQITAFLDADRTNPPPQGGVLFIGSSIFRQWRNVQEHMAPLPAYNRAFGGSRTWELLAYMDKIVLPYKPKMIVYYCGSNDVNAGEPASAIVDRVMQFERRVHAALPGTRIFFVSINKAPQKRAEWHVVDAANAALKARADALANFDYIEVNPVLFNANGEPRMELYVEDGLHFKPPAYDEFTKIIKPVLLAAWKDVSRTN
jgi:lysophospholipase L1-like esterase